MVPEPRQGLAGLHEVRFEPLQRVDGSGQRPAETAGELLRGARLPDAGEHRLDGPLVRGAKPVEFVDRAAPRVAGGVGVLAAECEIDRFVYSRATRAAGQIPGGLPQDAISAAAASS